MRRVLILCVLLFARSATAQSAPCWQEAEKAYGVSAELLYAIARAESDLNPTAMNLSHKARTGTYDIGLMQINSGHLPRLAKHGITEQDLLDQCTNVKVGAWVLSGLFARYGVNWNAVGAYNAACSTLRDEECTAARSKYAWRVFRRLPGSQPQRTAAPSATVTPARVVTAPPIFILAAKVSAR